MPRSRRTRSTFSPGWLLIGCSSVRWIALHPTMPRWTIVFRQRLALAGGPSVRSTAGWSGASLLPIELLGTWRGIWDASFGLSDERGTIVVDARPEPLAIDPGRR